METPSRHLYFTTNSKMCEKMDEIKILNTTTSSLWLKFFFDRSEENKVYHLKPQHRATFQIRCAFSPSDCGVLLKDRECCLLFLVRCYLRFPLGHEIPFDSATFFVHIFNEKPESPSFSCQFHSMLSGDRHLLPEYLR